MKGDFAMRWGFVGGEDSIADDGGAHGIAAKVGEVGVVEAVGDKGGEIGRGGCADVTEEDGAVGGEEGV